MLSHKTTIILVDNRSPSALPCQQQESAPIINFKDSGFKATQFDEIEAASQTFQEFRYLSQLQKRVEELESRVNTLERGTTKQMSKKIRRRTCDIERSYQCPFSFCGKLYGTETSLKNHIKIKHKSQ